MDLPKRKSLRLHEYKYSNVGAYFITLCTYNKQKLFQLEHDVGNGQCAVPPTNNMIHYWINQIETKFTNVSIDKYVVMPNHVHMIIIIREVHEFVSIENIMHWFKTITTNTYIREVKNNHFSPFDKKLWQKSYYDHIIRGEEDYRNVWEYIENNPLKWEMDKYYIL